MFIDLLSVVILMLAVCGVFGLYLFMVPDALERRPSEVWILLVVGIVVGAALRRMAILTIPYGPGVVLASIAVTALVLLGLLVWIGR